jgi:hypothetical protein
MGCLVRLKVDYKVNKNATDKGYAKDLGRPAEVQ